MMTAGNSELTPEQLRGARAMLGWSPQRLAERSGTHRRTIRKIEQGRIAKPQRKTTARIVGALQAGGVEFLERGAIRLKGS